MMTNERETLKLLKLLAKDIIIDLFSGGVQAGIIVPLQQLCQLEHHR